MNSEIESYDDDDVNDGDDDDVNTDDDDDGDGGGGVSAGSSGVWKSLFKASTKDD